MWYFTPFYAILRAVPDKLLGVVAMGRRSWCCSCCPGSTAGRVHSIRYRGFAYKIALAFSRRASLVLGYLGLQPPTPAYKTAAQVLGTVYFLYFAFLWVYTYFGLEKTKPVPERVTH